MKKIIDACIDFYMLVVPRRAKKSSYEYAFIVHPRGRHDVVRKYPFFKYVPDSVADVVMKYMWPVTLSTMTGLVSQKTGEEIKGHLITILTTAKQMSEDRVLALRRIRAACMLARKKGARIIGLGGLTSSFSRGGLDLIDVVDANITTGHAYTSHNVTQNILTLTEYMGLDRQKIKIGIIGASGSIGSTVSKLLAREGYDHFVLIDVKRKHDHFPELITEMKRLNPQIRVQESDDISVIKDCDIIVAATNAPEALIRSAYLKSGAIVVDDAQPSDVHREVLDREDVLVIEAGVTHTPGISNNFNFGLKNRQDNFCCLAEVFVLASHEWDSHYVINKATLDLVDDIAEKGKVLSFRIGTFQNFKEVITEDKLSRIRSIIKSNELQH